jgi:hypothetical protein
MVDMVCANRFADGVSFRKLLKHLHDTVFTYTLKKDADRAADGEYLRYRFAYRNGYDKNFTDGSSSVLEVMIAIAMECEESIMDDPSYGDRTAQWFWEMVKNLGLGGMTDTRYDAEHVDEVLTRFLSRKYTRDGRGGLFYIPGCTRDLRRVAIWHQLCWWLNRFV